MDEQQGVTFAQIEQTAQLICAGLIEAGFSTPISWDELPQYRKDWYRQAARHLLNTHRLVACESLARLRQVARGFRAGERANLYRVLPDSPTGKALSALSDEDLA